MPEYYPPEALEAQAKKQFETSVETGVSKAVDSVREKFENDPDRENNLEFHNTRHTQSMVARVEKILRAIKDVSPELVTEHTVGLGKLAGGWHDSVQKWERNEVAQEGKPTKVMRKRFGGANEKASAAEAVEFMEQANQQSGVEVFSKEDEQAVTEAIDATVPGFNPEKGTVIQPDLKETSPVIARALALADIGTAGMEGPITFLKEGDDLFREENLDIAAALDEGKEITDDQKAAWRERMLGWTKFQPVFANGRKALLESELAGLPDTAKEAVANLFVSFDQSIEAAEGRAERRANMTFEEIAADMGYKIK